MSGSSKLIAIILVLPLLASCATVVSTAHYTVPIRSEPTGARFVITDRNGRVTREGTTPALVELKASNGYFRRGIYRVELSKPGYAPAVTELRARMNGWYWGNLLIGPIGFLVIDPLTGAMYRLDQRMVYEGLGRVE